MGDHPPARTVQQDQLWDAVTAAAHAAAGHAGLRHTSPYALVLELGQWHHPTPLPGRMAPWREQLKACFATAARLADAHPGELYYVEGYADPGINGLAFPLEHAWCVDGQGRVVDPTWAPVGVAYLGVPLTPEFRHSRLTGTSSSVLLSTENADLYLQGLPIGAIAHGPPNRGRAPSGADACSVPTR